MKVLCTPPMSVVHYHQASWRVQGKGEDHCRAYKRKAARPAAAIAPTPASMRWAAPVTWRGPLVVALVGPTGVFVGAVVLTIGTVWVPEDRVYVLLEMTNVVGEGQ